LFSSNDKLWGIVVPFKNLKIILLGIYKSSKIDALALNISSKIRLFRSSFLSEYPPFTPISGDLRALYLT